MMKKSLRKILFAAAVCVFAAFSFASCTSEISLEFKKDGTVDVVFNGSAGKAFAAMIRSAAGLSGDASSNVIFDTKDIEYEMSSNGFSNVKAVSKTGTDLSVSMTDKNGKSALFSSGVVKVENKKLSAVLTPEKLVDFYSKADSQTVQFMDMLLAPVFNDEKMSEEEYLEVLASFYGEEIAEEMRDADFRITLKNPDGTKLTQTIKITKLLTLDEVVRF